MNPFASTSTFVFSRPGISEFGRRPIDTSTLSNTCSERSRPSSSNVTVDAVRAVGHRDDLRAEQHRLAHRLHALLEHGDEIAVGARQQPRRHLDHRHLRAECGVDGPELEADVAAADHQQRLRDIGQVECAAVNPSRAGCRAAGSGSSLGRDPVARIACSNADALHAVPRSAHRRSCGSTIVAVALDVAHLAHACRAARCRRSACATTWFFHSRSWSRSIRGSPKSTPHADGVPRFRRAASATCSSALDGMHPR